MQDSCITLSILTFVYSFFFHGNLALAATSGLSPSAYYPDEIILLNCGSSGNSTAPDDRGWMGDVGSKFTSSRLLNEASVSRKALHNHGSSANPVPYATARFFRSQFAYNFQVRPGPKFIRLYFYPASYRGFQRSEDFFSVKAGPYTLLSNFSASFTADSLGLTFLVKEFSVNINDNQRFINLTFVPTLSTCNGAFAFINGIEIISIPTNLYYTGPGDIGITFLGHHHDFFIKNDTALEAVHRLNVGGSSISANNDSGLFRRWLEDTSYLFESGVVLVNTTFPIKSTKIPAYAAPAQVYQTARSVDINKEVNLRHNLTWKLPVDPGFKYLVRLHFCAFQWEIQNSSYREFHIYINNETAEAYADVIAWSGGNGIPIYRDYVVFIQEGNRHLFIALRPNSYSETLYSDAILNGLEIFKLNKSDGNLVKPSHELLPARQPELFKCSGLLADNQSINRTSFIAIGGIAALFSLLGTFTFFCWRKPEKTKKEKALSLHKEECRHFTLAQIRAATHDFDKSLVIGEGGFGRVFKGYINGGETPVAIKGLKPTSKQGAREFWTEIEMLSRLRHLHLVSLIGYCNEQQQMILIYDYMGQGTLRDHLYKTDKAPLPWKQRLEICIGAARGVKYLHEGTEHKIIHRDVKTTNILLDEKWVAKVADFGLCKVGACNMSRSHITTDVKGTFGYLDPEYFWSQKLTEKSDVYSFGVVLFEVLCARPAVDMEVEEKQQSLSEWAKHCVKEGTLEQIIDPFLRGKIAPQSLRVFAHTAYRCVLDERHKRPKMAHVVKNLVRALELQESADAAESDSEPGGAYNEKIGEIISLNPTEIELLSIPPRATSMTYTCPAFWQRSMSPKALVRFLSDRAGIKRAKHPTPCASKYQRMPLHNGQVRNSGTNPATV